MLRIPMAHTCSAVFASSVGFSTTPSGFVQLLSPLSKLNQYGLPLLVKHISHEERNFWAAASASALAWASFSARAAAAASILLSSSVVISAAPPVSDGLMTSGAKVVFFFSLFAGSPSADAAWG